MLQIPDRLLEEPVVRQLLDASPLLFIALTGDGSVVWTSETSRRSLGWSEEFVADAHIVDMVHADDLGAVAATMAEEVRGSWEREHMVVRVRCGDGSYTHVEFGGMDLREPDGTGLYLVWGRSHESTVRLTTFMRAFGAGASLEELAIQVLGWFDASSDDNTATLSLRRGDGSYEAVPWGADVDLAARGPAGIRRRQGPVAPCGAHGRPRGGDRPRLARRLPCHGCRHARGHHALGAARAHVVGRCAGRRSTVEPAPDARSDARTCSHELRQIVLAS